MYSIHTCCNSVVNLAINDMTGLAILTKKFTLLKILLQDRIWYPSWSNNLKKSLVNLPNHCTSQWVFWYSGKCFRGRNPIIFPSQVSAAALQTSHSTANEVSWSHLLQFRVLEERLRDSLGRRCWQMRGSATRCGGRTPEHGRERKGGPSVEPPPGQGVTQTRSRSSLSIVEKKKKLFLEWQWNT